MRITQQRYVIVLRAVAVLVVSFGSLQLALRLAYALFLIRQGQSGLEALTATWPWLVVVGVGVVLNARGRRIGDLRIHAATRDR